MRSGGGNANSKDFSIEVTERSHAEMSQNSGRMWNLDSGMMVEGGLDL